MIASIRDYRYIWLWRVTGALCTYSRTIITKFVIIMLNFVTTLENTAQFSASFARQVVLLWKRIQHILNNKPVQSLYNLHVNLFRFTCRRLEHWNCQCLVVCCHKVLYVRVLVIAVSVITQEFICYHDAIVLKVISTVGYIFRFIWCAKHHNKQVNTLHMHSTSVPFT